MTGGQALPAHQVSGSLSARWGPRLGAALILLLPVACAPWLRFEMFSPAKVVTILALGLPAYVLSELARGGRPDALGWFRLVLAGGSLAVFAQSWILAGRFPDASLPHLQALLFPLVFLEIGAALARSDATGRRLLVLIAWSPLPVLLIGGSARLLQWPAALEGAAHGGLPATIGNSNELADFAAAPLLASLALLLAGCGSRVTALTGVLASGALLVWADSRGGMLAAGAGLIAMVLHRAWLARGRTLPRAHLLTLLVAVGLTCGVPTLRTRLASGFDLENPTVKVRWLTWRSTLDMIRDHPLAGVGAGGFEAAFPPYRSADEWRLSGPDTVVASPHQEWLWLASEGGLLGVVTALVILLLAMHAWRSSPCTDLPEPDALRSAAGGALVALGALTLFHAPFHHPAGGMVPILLLGALASRVKAGPVAAPWRLLGAAALIGLAVFSIRDLESTARLERVLKHEHTLAKVPKDRTPEAGARTWNVLRELTASIQDMASAPVVSPRRTWRATLVLPTLLRLRARFAAQGRDAELHLMPDIPLYEALLDQVLQRSPHLPLAVSAYAELDWQRSRFPAAIFRLKDAIAAVPAAPRLRRNLAELLEREGDIGGAWKLVAEELPLWKEVPLPLLARRGALSLRLATDAPTTGFYLDQRPAGPAAKPHLKAAERLTDEGDQAGAWQAALAALGYAPGDLQALNLVASIGFSERSEGALLGARRAVARSKLLIALDLERDGELHAARRNLRLALSRDVHLHDAWILKARIAAALNERSALLEALRSLRADGLTRAQLEPLLRASPALASLLASGELDEALR